MIDPPLFMGSEIYRNSSYGAAHPLAIPRVPTVIDLCRALGWLDERVYRDSPKATPAQLMRFHDPAYVTALQRAEREGGLDRDDFARFNLGSVGNPFFREIFSRPATACGASIAAAEILLDAGANCVYSPGGGTHHGRRDRASGFCYFNDPVLAMLRLLDGGIGRILYVDFDAHHCDGVADAFAEDPRIIIFSIHEENRWPRSGAIDETGCGNCFNLPVQADFNDSEMAFTLDALLTPLIEASAPEIIVAQCGADALAEDPLSGLALSNGALWQALASLKEAGKRLLVLGGGGYNPWSVARCWAGYWAILNAFPIPPVLPAEGEAVLRRLNWSRSAGRNPPQTWFTTLADPAAPGPIRPAIRDRIDRLLRRLPSLPGALPEFSREAL